MTKLHREYEAFLKVQETGVKPRTLELMRARLKQFPIPSKLNGDWFRKRITTKSKRTGKLLSPKTIKGEVVLAKRFLKWAELDASSLEKDKLRLPRPEETVTAKDLYSKAELAAIFNACIHTRDRALLQVLYESAARASELLSMTFEDTVFNEDGTATIIISGKTGTRPVPLYESVPALKAWLNAHPQPDGPIWTQLRRPHKTLTPRQSYGVLAQALDRAGIVGKKRIVHMMRHTRATELVRLGIRGQVLSKLMGWTKKSNMEAVYVHLSTEDVTNEIHAKVFGLAAERETRKPLLESTTCPRCNTKNTQDARICSSCNLPLSNDMIVQAFEKEDRLKEMEEKIERLSRFVDTIGERIKVNVGTKKKPKYIDAFLVKKDTTE